MKLSSFVQAARVKRSIGLAIMGVAFIVAVLIPSHDPCKPVHRGPGPHTLALIACKEPLPIDHRIPIRMSIVAAGVIAWGALTVLPLYSSKTK